MKDALEGFVSKEQISGYNCPKTNAEVCLGCHCIILQLYLLKKEKKKTQKFYYLIYHLIFTTTWANSADNKLMTFFLGNKI